MPVMLRHAIVCFVIALFDASQITSALQLRDLSRLIESLQHNEAKYNKRDDQSQPLDKNNGYVAISSQELDELINQAANDVYNRNENKSKKRYLQNLNFNDDRISDISDENLSHLFSQKAQLNPISDVLSKLYQGNSLDLDSENKALLEDSDSKVYLILDPRANLNNKDIKGISDMLSQILSGLNSKNLYSQRDPIKRKRRYKGFPIAEGSLARRRNRESKELYSPQDSMEDYKPKRFRGDYGGSGGRTPIPYIRHRDIYEKE